MNDDHAPNQFRGEFSDNFETELVAQRLFGNKSNRSHESRIREIELEELREAKPPTNILSIPESQRKQYEEACVVVPDFVQQRLSEFTFPMTADEVAEVEDMMMEYHQVAAPAWISINQNFKKTGKTWRYVPELESRLTPFNYFHP